MPRTPSCNGCPIRPWCAWGGDPSVPDPAPGSAAVSTRQSRFAGSDRQGGAALVRALTDGPVTADRLAEVMGWPADEERARRVAVTVVDQGLATVDDSGTFHLP